MIQSKEEFLQGCLQGWQDAMKETDEWAELTKSERKNLAKKAIVTFDKIHYSLSVIADYQSLILQNNLSSRPLK